MALSRSAESIRNIINQHRIALDTTDAGQARTLNNGTGSLLADVINKQVMVWPRNSIPIGDNQTLGAAGRISGHAVVP